MAIEWIDSLYEEKTFFKKDFKLDKSHITLSYDARFVPQLLNQNEDRNHKTFKFNFKNWDRDTAMLLDLWDIKTLLDNKWVFTKEIEYELEGKTIYKKFTIDSDMNFSYTDSEDTFSWKIDAKSMETALEWLKKDIVYKDLYAGGFYNKNYAYFTYKLKNFKANIEWVDKDINNKPKKGKLNKLV
jgi:hypothetical protein